MAVKLDANANCRAPVVNDITGNQYTRWFVQKAGVSWRVSGRVHNPQSTSKIKQLSVVEGVADRDLVEASPFH